MTKKATKREVQTKIIETVGIERVDKTLQALVFLYLEFNDDKLLKKVIYDKSFRPNSLSDQKNILYELSKVEQVSFNHRINAAIASSHKAMESLDLEFCHYMISYLNSFGDLASIGDSSNIREDKTHIFFSRLTVLFHLSVIVGDFHSAFKYSMQALEMFEKISVDDLSTAFYQSCTNVVRCLVLCYIYGVFSKDKELMSRSAQAIKKSFYFGITHSDSHKVKFKEYLEATSTWSYLTENHGFFSRFIFDEDCFEILKNFFLKSLRVHSPEKVEYMKLKFIEYMRENL